MVKLKDGRQFGFCIVDNRILDQYGEKLGGDSLAVYLCLVRHAGRDRETWPSYREMARVLGYSAAKVCRCIKALLDLGLITSIRKVGKVQVYRITDPREESACAPGETVCASSETPKVPSCAPPVKQCAPVVKHPCACGETVQENAPLVGLNKHQQQQQEPIAAAAGAQEILIESGLSPATAAAFANAHPRELLEKVVEYWKNGAGSTKLPGTGLLVSLLKSPTAAGFTQIGGEWKGPKIHPSFQARSPPGKPVTPAIDKAVQAAELAEKRRQAEEQARVQREELKLEREFNMATFGRHEVRLSERASDWFERFKAWKEKRKA